MAKPSDIRNRLSAPPPAAANTISLNQPGAKVGDEHKNTAPKPDMGGPQHKTGKAMGGGGGQSSGRPKV